MSVTIVETNPANKKYVSTIAIRPYVDPQRGNMGLEKYDQALFDGIFHEEQLACLEINGIKRWVTGLNEFAPEIKKLSTEEREAAVLEIRKTVSVLEAELAANFVDPTDKDFWNKVKLLSPNNDEFWGKITIRMSNEPVFLTAADPHDLIKLKAIEAGGFSLVAKTLDVARKSSTGYKFYLDKYEETASIKTEVKKIRNKSLAELEKLANKNVNKLMYVCKVVDPNSPQYKKSTPTDVMYDNMDKYINGETVDTDKKKTAQRFMDIANLDMETLKLRAIIKDSTYYKLIVTRGDGYIYHTESSTLLGKNPSEIVEFLKNPLHEDILVGLTKGVERYWNN
ncbi:MAG: hypothetical protein WCK31_01565 [bacterium]